MTVTSDPQSEPAPAPATDPVAMDVRLLDAGVVLSEVVEHRRAAEQCEARVLMLAFPGCRVDARACDLDHIDAYVDRDDGGPPGQTRPANLACLCRRHHRLKTFTAWDYVLVAERGYRWTSPRGQAFISAPVTETRVGNLTALAVRPTPRRREPSRATERG